MMSGKYPIRVRDGAQNVFTMPQYLLSTLTLWNLCFAFVRYQGRQTTSSILTKSSMAFPCSRFDLSPSPRTLKQPTVLIWRCSSIYRDTDSKKLSVLHDCIHLVPNHRYLCSLICGSLRKASQQTLIAESIRNVSTKFQNSRTNSQTEYES